MRDNVALPWNTAALEAVRRTRMGPPIVARALHVLHVDLFLRGGRLRQAAGRARLRPRRRRARGFADWTGRRPVNELMRLLDLNRWQPLPTPDGAGQRFLVPHRGLVAPFALASGWELRPRGARRHPGPGFLAQAAELLADSARLTDEHKAIAEYWADGPDTETRPATGACSPRRCRSGTATAWTRTCGCSPPSPCRLSGPVRAGGRRAGRGRRPPGRAPAPSGTGAASS
jgi:hypothetical protein